MNLLLTRFSLLLVMIVAIAGTSYVQGGNGVTPASDKVREAACQVEGVITAAETIPARQNASRGGQRPVRWQSLLPGTFR